MSWINKKELMYQLHAFKGVPTYDEINIVHDVKI